MSRLPTLNGLQAFEATARHLSFAQAADELNLTPSAVSYQVRTLEDRLGVALFERLNRAIVLTEAGEMLFPDLREAFARMRGAVNRLSADTPENVLVVSTGPSFAAKWLAPRLFSFMDEHPQIEVRISANLKLVDFNRDGIDVGIRFGEGNYPGLETRWLIGDELTVLGSPQFLAEHAIKSPHDVPAQPLIIDDSLAFNPNSPNWEKWFQVTGVPLTESVRGVHFNHADHAIDAAVRGTGLVLARTSLARSDMDTGLLVELFPELRISTEMAFYLVMPPMAGNKPKVQAFTSWILREFGLEEEAPTPS